jgi:hypothetical protein
MNAHRAEAGTGAATFQPVAMATATTRVDARLTPALTRNAAREFLPHE